MAVEKHSDQKEKDQTVATCRTLFNGIADFLDMCKSFVTVQPAMLFRRIMAHEGLGSEQWNAEMKKLREDADLVAKMHPRAILIVFVDELNTSGAVGWYVVFIFVVDLSSLLARFFCFMTHDRSEKVLKFKMHCSWSSF